MVFLIIFLFVFLYVCNFSMNYVFLFFGSNIILSYVLYVSMILLLFKKDFLCNLNVTYKIIHFLNTFKNNFLSLSNNFKKKIKYSYINIKWKPLFKKSSYFGLYRTNKHQWLNK